PGLVARGLRTALGLGALAAAGTVVLAPFVLGLLGHRYAEAGAAPLRVLALAVFPFTFTQGYFAVCRARRRLREAVITGSVSLLVGVVAAALVARAHGLTGIAVAWLCVQTAAGAFAAWRLRVLVRPP